MTMNNIMETKNLDMKEKKTVVSQRTKKVRKYFDSADWAISGNSYEKLPVKNVEEKKEEPKVNPTEVDDENKENIEKIEVIELHSDGSSKSDRKYFDSADWAMSGKAPLPSETYKGFNQPKPSTLITKKKLNKTKKYFDSADWMLSKQESYVPQLFPKLAVV